MGREPERGRGERWPIRIVVAGLSRVESLDCGPAEGDKCRGSIPRGPRRPWMRAETCQDGGLTRRLVAAPALTVAMPGPVSASATGVSTGCLSAAVRNTRGEKNDGRRYRANRSRTPHQRSWVAYPKRRAG